ncbi:MAG TPA: acyltransferase [Puia sp.]|nr:acyltransferase [Puia sp.]
MATTTLTDGSQPSGAMSVPIGKSRIEYLPQLDSLRTLAVIMTLLAHTAPVMIPYMHYGVPIFFTISGFLITTILLNTANATPPRSRPYIIKNFVVRRALRLFPVYYLFLVFFWFAKNHLSLFLWKDEFTPYFFTYTANIYVFKFTSGAAGCFAHLWSLSVEEQFYLFWPWILLYCPSRYRIPVIVGMISFALIFVCCNYKNDYIGSLPFGQFHNLGVGALLAVFYVKNAAVIRWLKDKRHLLFLLTFVHLIFVLIIFHQSAFFSFYRELSLCSCTFSIVLVSIFGWKGFMGYIMGSRPMRYIGTISYGIYLYHMPVPYIWRLVMARLDPNLHLNGWVLTGIWFGIIVLIAAVSYKYIETPFLKLKSYFV